MSKAKAVLKTGGARFAVERKTQTLSVPETAELPTQKKSVETTNKPVVLDLHSIPLFKEMPTRKLSKYEGFIDWHTFKHGEKVLEKGERSSDVYFIVTGGAHVLNFADTGRVIDFSVLGPGAFFGELAAIDGLPRSATVVTEGASHMAVLPGDKFLEIVMENSSVAMAIFNRMATIIRMGDVRITDLSVLGAEQRVCLELLRLAIPDPVYFDNYDRLVVYPVPTQQLMANNIGVTRETVARIFGRLSSEGIIERKAKTLYIRDKLALENLTLSNHL